MRVILISNKGLKKTGRSLIRMRLLFQMTAVVNALVLREFVSIVLLPILKYRVVKRWKDIKVEMLDIVLTFG